MVASEAEGRAGALRRIAACRASQAEELDLGGLQLATLDGDLLAALCQLDWLRRLFLGSNAETREKLKLPLEDGEINSKCNALGALPDVLFNALPRLERLDLALNRLQGLPASIANLTDLAILDLAGNSVGAEGAHALKDLINLTSLDLAYNRVRDDGAQALKGLVNLASLDLTANGIGDDGAQALKGLINLTSLDLLGNGIWAEGAQALKDLVNLTSLNLASNRIGDEGAQTLEGLVNLTSLNLAYNGIGDISSLVSLRDLREINLSGTNLDHDIPALWMLPSLQNAILHNASLPGVPVEILSKSSSDNCLDRLRAHLAERAGREDANLSAAARRQLR
jgi:Leucine-rich repeat (LRR) protein